MKIDAGYKIEEGCSTDDREYLRHAFTDGNVNAQGEARMFATDGHILVSVPIEMEKGDVPGFVSSEAIKTARKARIGPRDRLAVITLSETTLVVPGSASYCATYPRPVAGKIGTFPKAEEIIPRFAPETTPTMARIYVGASALLVEKRRALKAANEYPTEESAVEMWKRGQEARNEEGRRYDRIEKFLDRRDVVTFVVDLRLLARTMKAIGSNLARITIPRAISDRPGPFEVRSRSISAQDGSAFAVVMPCVRVKGKP